MRAAPPLVAVSHHRGGVLDALVLPDQPATGDGDVAAPHPAHRDFAAVELLAQLFQPAHRLGLQAAVGQLLDPVGQPALQEAPVMGRGGVSNSAVHGSFSFVVRVVFKAVMRANTVS